MKIRVFKQIVVDGIYGINPDYADRWSTDLQVVRPMLTVIWDRAYCDGQPRCRCVLAEGFTWNRLCGAPLRFGPEGLENVPVLSREDAKRARLGPLADKMTQLFGDDAGGVPPEQP